MLVVEFHAAFQQLHSFLVLALSQIIFLFAQLGTLFRFLEADLKMNIRCSDKFYGLPGMDLV